MKRSEIIKYDKKEDSYQVLMDRTLKNDLEQAYAFMCDLDTLFILYELEKRRFKRYWISIYLIHLGLADKNKIVKEVFPAVEKMENILKTRLRCGDIVSKWGNKNFLIMLMNIKNQDVKKVIERIENSFGEYKEIEIYYKYYKIKRNITY